MFKAYGARGLGLVNISTYTDTYSIEYFSTDNNHKWTDTFDQQVNHHPAETFIPIMNEICIWCFEPHGAMQYTSCCLRPICPNCLSIAADCTPECGAKETDTHTLSKYTSQNKQEYEKYLEQYNVWLLFAPHIHNAKTIELINNHHEDVVNLWEWAQRIEKISSHIQARLEAMSQLLRPQPPHISNFDTWSNSYIGGSHHIIGDKLYSDYVLQGMVHLSGKLIINVTPTKLVTDGLEVFDILHTNNGDIELSYNHTLKPRLAPVTYRVMLSSFNPRYIAYYDFYDYQCYTSHYIIIIDVEDNTIIRKYTSEDCTINPYYHSLFFCGKDIIVLKRKKMVNEKSTYVFEYRTISTNVNIATYTTHINTANINYLSTYNIFYTISATHKYTLLTFLDMQFNEIGQYKKINPPEPQVVIDRN
jgi:hypothetical protein